MPTNAPVSFTPGTLPPNYCFTTWQQLYIDMVGQLSGYLPGNFSTINYGDTTPDPEDQDKAWLRTVGGIPERWYVYYGGSWVWPNPSEPSGYERRMWAGPLVGAGSLETYDGGVAGVVTDTTGPMWEVDTASDGRVPLGPGTLPLSSTVVAVGDTGGLDENTLALDEIPAHDHGPDQVTNPNNLSFAANSSVATGAGAVSDPNATFNLNMFRTGMTGGDGYGGTTPITNMPPYIGRYFIKRTARLFYTP